ncbi:MAG: hypothetical protein ACI31A_08620 [Candidatus Limisoma sp.]
MPKIALDFENLTITAAGGVRFAVSTQWGDNFASFQRHVTEQLGWTLKEIE